MVTVRYSNKVLQQQPSKLLSLEGSFGSVGVDH